MAIITNIITGEQVILRSHHVFGRQLSNTDTRLTQPETSNIHASIRWDGEKWSLKDHSLNGTWLDNHRVLKNSDIELKVAQKLSFGSSKNAIWKIQHLAEPSDMLLSLDAGQSNIILSKLQVLPTEDAPEVSLYISESGQWVCEQADTTSFLNNGDIIKTSDGRRWSLYLTDNTELTTDISVDQYTEKDKFDCYFKVSADEEHVFLKIKYEDVVYDLEERVHHYLLLVLSRQRELDVNKGFDEPSQGWLYMDDLCNMLGVPMTHLNILIFRARKQLQQIFANLSFTPQLIERRSGEIRFGFSHFHYQ